MPKPFPPRNRGDTPLTPKIFRAGARHYLHPKLAILDQIDCVLEYYPESKAIIVSYAPETRKKDYTDYEETVYAKAIMSSNIDFIVNVISKDYITPMNEKMHQQINGEFE